MPKRRAKGDGSVYRRKDGRWAGIVYTGFRDGRRARKVVYGPTRVGVQERVRQLVESARQGITPGRSQRLEEFFGVWLQTIEGSIRPSTFTSYSGVVRNHLLPSLGRIFLERLAVQDVAALMSQKREDGLSPRTAQYILFVLRNALNKAVKWGAVSRNVAALVDAPRVPHQDVKVLSPGEAMRLIGVAREDNLEALWVLALSTGLRRGELLGLTWDDLDMERRQLRVTRTLQRVSGKGLILSETKTRRGRRSIVLPVGAVAALRRHRQVQSDHERLAGESWVKTNFVFTSSQGTALDGDNVSRSFTQLLARAGLARIRFHDLRHSCA